MFHKTQNQLQPKSFNYFIFLYNSVFLFSEVLAPKKTIPRMRQLCVAIYPPTPLKTAFLRGFTAILAVKTPPIPPCPETPLLLTSETGTFFTRASDDSLIPTGSLRTSMYWGGLLNIPVFLHILHILPFLQSKVPYF